MKLAAHALVLCSLAVGCGRQTPPRATLHEDVWSVMGTVSQIKLAAVTQDYPEDARSQARRIFEKVETTLSLRRADSDIARLNAAAGSAVTVSGLTADMLKLSIRYAELTDGRFDVTVAPLVRLWGFSGGDKPERIPAPETVQARLAMTGYSAIHVAPDGVGGYTARLDRTGMSVDLGGIAKGYAVDWCARALLESGYTNFLINLGGDMVVFGEPEPGRNWIVGVRDPFDRTATLGSLALPHGRAVATSGNYERFVEIEGRRFAHIIDPRTGLPVEGMAGVTVMASNATEADALSTALYVAGLHDGLRLLARFPDAEALFALDDGPRTIIVTPGFKARFAPRPDLGNRFRVIAAPDREGHPSP